ncbi:MAG: segregation/condensation protein A [Halodesulfurarchaeum sp.]
MTDVSLLEGRDVNTAGVDEDDVEPVELLVQLAEQGEIEPWDIDIVRVTDKFLDALDDGDLRRSGRALFYASVLLRMKSEELLNPQEEESAEPDRLEPFDTWEEALPPPEDGESGGDPIDVLEEEIDRRLDRKTARGTPETLDELVRELRSAERGSWWKENRSYDTSNSPRGFSRGVQTLDYRTGDDMRQEGEPGESDVTSTTHDEDIDELIEAVRTVLEEHYSRGRPEVLFEEISGAAGSRVETFLALLFLSHRGEVVLQQSELFGDLWIQAPGGTDSSPGSVVDAGHDSDSPAADQGEDQGEDQTEDQGEDQPEHQSPAQK